MRETGGGRINKFEEFWHRVKTVLTVERLLGHHLERSDLLHEFIDQVQARIHLYAEKGRYTELLDSEKAKVNDMKSRLEKLQCNEKYRASYTKRLGDWCGFTVYQPQRFTLLSASEEELRCHLSWQMRDRITHLAAFGDAKELYDFVAKPEEFIKNRRSTVIFMADQIPFWIKIGSRKALFANWEIQSRRQGLGRGSVRFQKSSQALAALVEAEDLMRERADKQTQLRGMTNVDQDKARVCLEARQAIIGYFDDSRDPVGVIMPSLLVVHGAHAQLSNIDENHRRVADEKFYVGSKLCEFAAGSYTSSLFEYVELRKENPEWFKELVVFSQPAACVDEIIYVWSVEDVATRYPQVIAVRDLLGVAMTNTSKVAMRLASQIPVWIGPGMTPVLQWTDTDGAFVAKRGADAEKQKLMREKRDAHKGKDGPCKYTCGPREMMQVALAAHRAMVEKNDATSSVLAGCRRNGDLAWRPDYQQMRLVPSHSQSWAKDLPEGSHRQKDSWIVPRYDWLDEKGKPVPEDWSKIAGVTKKDNPMELQFANEILVDAKYTLDYTVQRGGKQITMPVINLEFEGAELMEVELFAQLITPPKARRLERQAEEIARHQKAEKKPTKERKRQIEFALAKVDQAWAGGCDEDLKEKTVSEVLHLLLPRSSNKVDRAPAAYKKRCKKDRGGEWAGERGVS